MDNQAHCNFCGKGERELIPATRGSTQGFICRECLAICADIRREQPAERDTQLDRVTALVDSLYQDFGTTSVLNIEREVLIEKVLEFVTDP